MTYALIEAAGLSAARLPALRPAGSVAGEISREAAQATGLRPGTQLVLGGGDQQCAALGLGVTEPGEAGVCLGTAAVACCVTDHPVADARGRYSCTAHVLPKRFVLEGIHNTFSSRIR